MTTKTKDYGLSTKDYGLKQINILITGGCGFIGLNLIDFLIKKGFSHLRILDNLSVGKKEDLESLLSEHSQFTRTENGNKIIYTLPLNPSKTLSFACPACPVGRNYRTGVKYLPCEMRSIFLWGEAYFTGELSASNPVSYEL